MRTLFKITNIFLIVAMIACIAGALAGLIVFFPFVAGAWALNLVALLGYEEAARTVRSERPRPAAVEAAPAEKRVPVTSPDAPGSIPVTHAIS